MKAQRPLGLALSWPRLLAVFLADVGILALVSNWPEAWRRDIAWWTGVGIAAAVAIAVLLTYHRVPVGALILSWVRNFFTKAEPKLVAGATPAIDHRHRYGHAMVGVREYRNQLVAVIAVWAPVEAPAGRHSQSDAGNTELPVQAIAAGLRQFDVRLEAIDIITISTTGAAGERSPSAWLVLRMDPQRNVDAVAVRDSLASTLAAATERVAEDLGRRRFEAWPLTAAELADLDTTVLAGLRPEETAVRLRYLKQVVGKECYGYVTSFWVSPKDLDPDTLKKLWAPDVDAAVLTVRLTLHHNQVEVSAWVRYHSVQRLSKETWRGLNRLGGRQLAAVLTGQPVPARQALLSLPARALQENDPFTVPLRSPVRAGPVEVEP